MTGFALAFAAVLLAEVDAERDRARFPPEADLRASFVWNQARIDHLEYALKCGSMSTMRPSIREDWGEELRARRRLSCAIGNLVGVDEVRRNESTGSKADHMRAARFLLGEHYYMLGIIPWGGNP